MIKFKSAEELVSFIEQKLPPKIKEQLFTEKYKRIHKGEEVENKLYLKPWFVVGRLRYQGFVLGLADNPDDITFPNTLILLWTKLKYHLEQNDVLSFEQEKYRLISINKACEMLEVTRPTLYKLINENKIPFVEVLSQKRIQLKDLLDYIDNNKKFK
jgi:excisionase family DNA binding protein